MILPRVLVLFFTVFMTGCVAPSSKEASMDWAAFIESVPGKPDFDDKYKTPTIKTSAYRYDAPSLDQIEHRFVRWCQAQNGKVPNSSSSSGAALSFQQATVDWNHQEQAFSKQLYAGKTNVCVDASGKLVFAMLVHQYNGYLGMPIEQSRLPAPVVAFYTAEQAVQFVDFYKARRAVLEENYRLTMQQEKELQDQNTRLLRAKPKIGDKTHQGIIIDLRPPLALIQYDATHRLMFQRAQSNWVPINELVAPR